MIKQDDDYKNYATEVLSLIETENKAIAKDGWKIKPVINLRLFEDWSYEVVIGQEETDENYDEGIDRYAKFCDRINLDWAHYIMGVKLLDYTADKCLRSVELDYST